MTMDASPVSVGLRELETCGRRLGETQGVSAHALVDWVAYGRAAQDALRRGHGIPLVGPFVAAERSSDLNGAHLRTRPAPSRPVPIRIPPLLTHPPSPRPRHGVRLASANHSLDGASHLA